jgi:pimeloyl-ACP methyl ester carboxylesterase
MKRPARHLTLLFGWCIALCVCLVCGGTYASEPVATTAIGTLHGASYRIDVPAHWNHRLVVYFHGYTDAPVVFHESEALSPMFDPLLARGYAVLQSGYSQGGWAVEQAAADTDRLRLFFTARHGAPVQTLVMGMSMGGTLTAMTIEQHPGVYAGALSLCGAVGPSDQLVSRDLALRAAFDYYFPGLLGPLAPVAAGYRADAATVARIDIALQSNPRARQSLLRWYRAANADNLPDVVAFVGVEMRELQQRAHGNPVGNANLIYVGTGDDDALNDGVRRYRADPAAAAYLARWYTPTGRLLRPMLALHDTGDPQVPAYDPFAYALAAERAGHGGNFVQQYVHHEGHCAFTPQQIGVAFDELTRWVDAGIHPRAGRMP